MQSIKFKYLINIFIILFCLFAFAFANQQFDILYKLYAQNDFRQLRQNVEELNQKYPDSIEIRFFKALFISDGETAKGHYLFTFEQGKDRIKLLAAKKLMDYYYARGYYVNASKYQKYLVENEQRGESNDIITNKSLEKLVPSTGKKAEQYFIQVGAFGYRDNAQQLSDMLATQNIETNITLRQIQDKKLFCVWIKGKRNFEETLNYANRIKVKYDLEFRIIKK